MTGSRIVNVIQGEYAISDDPHVVQSTLLGSCVSSCIFDAGAAIGGMNHFLLPASANEVSTNLRYGAYLMELLINELLKHGAQRSRLQAKLFGGGNMNAGLKDIGAMNVAFAREFLARENITVATESVGGGQARRIQFVPTTGAARQKFVANVSVDPVQPPPRPVPKDDAIEFF